jgi:hypothetical protein
MTSPSPVSAWGPAALAVLVLAAQACDSAEPSETLGGRRLPFTTGWGPARGHEDVLRFGTDFANDLLTGEVGTYGFYPRIYSGEDCVTSTNPLVLGNGATDFPDDVIAAFYRADPDHWHDSPTLQDLHFLRNWVGADGVETPREACVGAQQRVIEATRKAGEAWRSGWTTDAYYWIGHATHILQDSFATPHTLRMGAYLRTLVDVCTYDRELPGVCYHSTVATGDRVWETTFSCEFSPDDRSWDCLTPEAQDAALATTGYLLVVGRWLNAGAVGDVGPRLETWFTGPAVDIYTGYFSCEWLDGLALGEVCTDGRVCDSGACVDDVCCSGDCGECSMCDAWGLEGSCTAADEGTDPHGDCWVSGGDPSCAGSCNGFGSCAFPGEETRCGLCSACDGQGRCMQRLADDDECGAIDCSGLDSSCRRYADRTTDRCAGLGRCRTPNTLAYCTEWTDLPCDADATDTMRDTADTSSDAAPDTVPGDGAPEAEPDGSFDAWPEPPANDSGCSCATAPPRSPWAALLLLACGAAAASIRAASARRNRIRRSG